MNKNAKNNEWNIADILTSRSGIFHPGQYLIIPNVSWGFDLNFECDLLICSKSKILYEVEIKSSKQDLKNDFKKWRYRLTQNNHHKIAFKYYAMPKELITDETKELIPIHNGIIEVDLTYNRAKIIRKAKKNPKFKKIDRNDYEILLRLAALRYWSIRHKLFSNKYWNENE